MWIWWQMRWKWHWRPKLYQEQFQFRPVSGGYRVFSFQKLPVSWNQVIERYTSESHKSIYSLENAGGNLTLNTGWSSSLQLTRRVFGSHCLDQIEHRRGFYLLLLSKPHTDRAGWMLVNDQASLPADKCLVLDLEQNCWCFHSSNWDSSSFNWEH